MESIWNKIVKMPEFPALDGDMETEAVVIGGGMSGILTAFHLQQKGIRTVVLEASRIGSGQTGNTTAKITASHNLIYQVLVQDFGREAAWQYAEANRLAIEKYARMIETEKIDCEFVRCPSYLYTQTDPKKIKLEAAAAKNLGFEAEFTTETELPFAVQGAVKFENQANFNPLTFLKAAAEKLEIYEQTLVENVEGNDVFTVKGRVRAQHIVFACHFPFINFPGYYFLRMHQERSYAIAFENVPKMKGMYLGIDESGLSFRSYQNKILLGGAGHRTGENKAGGRYQQLRKQGREFWPDSQEDAFWSAQDCTTLDGIPYIGRYSASNDDWYVATGFGKWGMTTSMVAAMLISGQITGEEPEWAEVFSPQRFELSASAKNMLEDGSQTIRGLGKRLFSFPDTAVEELPAGHGGIVEYDGEKVGVYKNEEGVCYIVSNYCTHLGCQLEWNPDEKSWECPCHGSRFDYRGKRLDGPAKEDLLNEERIF